jgi:hypothetical protein
VWQTKERSPYLICIEVFRPDELGIEKLKLEESLKVKHHEQKSKKEIKSIS